MVIIILEHGVDLIYAFWGAVLHGAIPSILPFLSEKLSPEIYRQSLSALIEITSPAAFITYPAFVGEVQQAAGGTSSPSAILTNAQVGRQTSFSSQSWPGLERDPDEIVLLQHSSGTTGLKKGVALSHRSVFNQLESYAAALNLNNDDIVVSWLPLYHDMGLIAGFLLPILSGLHLVLMSPFDWVKAPQKLFQAITQYQATLTWIPNFAYNFCAKKIRSQYLEGVDLSSLRAVTNCSETIHWRSHQIFLERFEPYGLNPTALAASYAMAENVFAVTQGGGGHRPMSVDEIDARDFRTKGIARPSTMGDTIKWVSSGTPLENVEIRILDENLQDMPERHVGEIVLRSNCTLSEYFKRPSITQKAFLDGWYRTGDIGYLADGEVYVTGRKKELIIVGGKNIYPQDLERLANDVPGVHPGRVVAFGVYNENIGTEEIVLIAESETTDTAQKRRIATQIRQKINQGTDTAVRYVRVVKPKWLIKTSSGKIARGANRQKYLDTRD
ncbi:MAG: putative ligase [Chloroflexi bacterium]|nr:putative ligase [Chloroflexota bacterium]